MQVLPAQLQEHCVSFNMTNGTVPHTEPIGTEDAHRVPKHLLDFPATRHLLSASGSLQSWWCNISCHSLL